MTRLVELTSLILSRTSDGAGAAVFNRIVAKRLPNLGKVQVRDPTAWTVLQQDGPNHLGLWHNALSEHQMALITSGCVDAATLMAYSCNPHV